MNASELKNLVSKITKARKIQKDKIDQQSEFQQMEQESISKLQAPVIKEISKQGAITQRSLFNQSAAARRAIQLQERQLKELEKFPKTIQAILPPKPVVTEEPQGAQAIEQAESPNEFSTPGKQTNSPERLEVLDPNKSVTSVQRFYATYRNQNRSKITQFELNFTTGTIGQTAEIDIPELINNNQLYIKFEELGRKEFPRDSLTPGLLGLILLPYDDMKQAGISPTKKDLEYYFTTMKYAGYVPSSSAKYKKYVQPFVKEDPKEGSKDGPKETPKSTTKKTPKKKTGSGLFVYKHPNELENRLTILIGSIHAGNNSTAIKSEVKSIVDKLFELGHLTPALHKKFFAKYNL